MFKHNNKTERDSSSGASAPPPSQTAEPQNGESSVKKPSIIKRLWTKLDLDLGTVMMMFKGSLPPIIAIAAFQAPAFSSHFGTLGYLVAITSILAFCIMPRGKFIQTMILNVIAICLSAAVNLLALYSAVEARRHTARPGDLPNAYNSSASAVLAIWLLFQVYLINCLRAARPQFQFPAILYSIFVAVATTYGTQFPNMTYSIAFMKQLLEAFLVGFGIATGVSLFIIPVSSRTVVLKEMTGYMMCLGGLLQAQTAYMQSLEEFDPRQFARDQANSEGSESKSKKGKGESAAASPHLTAQAQKVQEMMQKILELHTKLPGDLEFAKREIAIGKLSGADLKQIWKQLQRIMIPIAGLSTAVDILRRRDEHYKDGTEQEKTSEVERVHSLMSILHEPFDGMTKQINAAFQHIMLTLELTKPPKKSKTQDEESQGSEPKPGTTAFVEHYKKRLDVFHESRKRTIVDWCREHQITLPANFFEADFSGPEQPENMQAISSEEFRQELFFMLYLEYLLWRGGSATLDLLLWAEEKKQDGTLKKTRLIIPTNRILRKWAISSFGREDSTEEDQYTADMDNGRTEALDLGASFSRKKDPEHLPPKNAWEKFGNVVRLIPRALRSDASAFGLRVAAATMCIAIVCFLQDTQIFFLQNRLLWAMIMVAISMTRTAGQSIFNFLLRILGTVIAMIGSFIIWYIVDGRTAGVIVFLWLWIFLSFYVVLKIPKLVVVGILSLVTAILIIGYELEIEVLGVAQIEANGQPAYPVYLLAPYRLATVTGGLALAFIWTIFPYPISESTELRKDLGASLYLMANFYSVLHETVKSRLQGNAGHPETKGTRAYHLEKARVKVFTKLVLLTTTLKANSAFSKFQITLGGQFPREEYESLIVNIQNLLRYCSLLSYASATFSPTTPSPSSSSADNSPSHDEWTLSFRRLLLTNTHTSHELTSLLALLSSSLLHGRPLPPYLTPPTTGRYVTRLNKIDHEILKNRHIADPEYAAFAVMQICARCMQDDIAKIQRTVTRLVGEIDFSFHAVSSERGSEETLGNGEEKRKKAEGSDSD